MSAPIRTIRLKLFFILFILSTLANAQYTKLFDFATEANGSEAVGTLITNGTFLYGMTRRGGSNSSGVIFKIKPDGTSYTRLLDFSGAANGTYPYGALIADSSFFYGMTFRGGASDLGIIFKIKPDGTSFAKLLDFAGVTNGNYPVGSLIYDNVFLYGMTSAGGINDKGTIFKIKPDGTCYTKLLDFSGIENGTGPYGSLVNDGTFLYGMTSAGGVNDKGVIFKIKPDGTGYAKLLDFSGAENGRSTEGSLIFDGTFLYGMTYYGGTNDKGTVFKIKAEGTGYTKLLDFSGAANGSNPVGDLIFNGASLYGMTRYGGANNLGVLFKIDSNRTGYTKLIDFTGDVNGSTPWGSLIYNAGFVYGTTHQGGINDLGTIFKYRLATSGIIEKHAITNFALIPNPSSGIFQLQIPENSDIYKLEVYNIVGEKVYSSSINSGEETIALDVPNGVYIVKLKTGKGESIKKLIIQK